MSHFRVLLDMDGVVADFVAGAKSVHYGKIPQSLYHDPADCGDKGWDILKHFDGTPEEFWSPFGYNFWKSLPPMPDAFAIYDTIERYVHKDNICFLTSPCRTEGCYEGKREWAHKHFPGVPILFSTSVPGGSPPKQFVADHNSILIDDHSLNVRNWIDYDGIGFLYPRPWNSLYTKMGEALNELDRFLAATLLVDCYRVAPLEQDSGLPAAQ